MLNSLIEHSFPYNVFIDENKKLIKEIKPVWLG
jgi:hypothetical protein